MTREQLRAALRAEFQVASEKQFPSSNVWIDVVLASGELVTIELTKNDIGVSILEEGAPPFGGHDRAFVDPAEVLEFIRSAARSRAGVGKQQR